MRASELQTVSRARRRWGLSLVEVMISLAITSMLLTAVCAAFSASAEAVQANDEFFRATQAARVTLNQVLTEVRRAHAVNVSGNQIDLFTANNADISYVFSPTAKTLKLRTNAITTDPDYTLCSSITNHSFAADSQVDAGGISHVVRVSVMLEVKVGDNVIRLTGAAAPRRAQSFTW